MKKTIFALSLLLAAASSQAAPSVLDGIDVDVVGTPSIMVGECNISVESCQQKLNAAESRLTQAGFSILSVKDCQKKAGTALCGPSGSEGGSYVSGLFTFMK